ncbi:sigma-70 family RNA polymerase sigma factor [Haloferula sp. A504]|uniref:sigma-70 family RNA polymerase sigma factor n=1 Tax=Haloferula sp. A504 TaxID=3373601 RepID=UPI0031CAB47F|nr:sigma-70 family RNA polymerase sigma factor [Verrucomicrobiaceae bacterium E54]
MPEPDKEFVYELTDWQNRLFGYLVTLLGNLHDARDVLQETNLVMWRRMDTFTPGTDFGAWARKCAYFQAMAFLRDRKRGPSLLGEELLALIAEEEERACFDENERKLALRDCLGQLDDDQRRLIKSRYDDQVPVRKLATDCGKSESAMKMTLMRLRELLQVCISSKMRETAP